MVDIFGSIRRWQEMEYEILASGSDGNCIIVNNLIAIDMGISYKKLKQNNICEKCL